MKLGPSSKSSVYVGGGQIEVFCKFQGLKQLVYSNLGIPTVVKGSQFSAKKKEVVELMLLNIYTRPTKIILK